MRPIRKCPTGTRLCAPSRCVYIPALAWGSRTRLSFVMTQIRANAASRCLTTDSVQACSIPRKAFSGARYINRRRKMAQIGHHAQVFCVETATLVVGDNPDRADRLPTHVEREQQALFDVGRHRGQVLEMAFGARKQ